MEAYLVPEFIQSVLPQVHKRKKLHQSQLIMPGIWGLAQEDMLCSWVLVSLAIVSSHVLQYLAELFLTLDIILYVCICPSSIDDVYTNEITLNMVFTCFTCVSLVGGSELGPTQNSTPMTLFSDTRRAFCTSLFMFGKCEPNKMLLSRTRIQPRDAREIGLIDWCLPAWHQSLSDAEVCVRIFRPATLFAQVP